MAINDVARVYATSLVELGQEKNNLDQYEVEIQTIAHIVEEDNDFSMFLDSPSISKEAKKEVVHRIFSDSISEGVLNFINVLIDNERQSNIEDINEAMTEIIDVVNNRLKVTIFSCDSLDSSTIESIQSKLQGMFHKEIIIDEIIDKEILGGIIIKVGDMVIDGSLIKDLKNIRKSLLNSKVRSELVYEN